MLKGKTVVVGVTGGIAAYKSAELVSSLRKAGANVRVVMTEHACRFVAPLTFETLSAAPVITDMFSDKRSWEVEHVSLAKQADAVVIAPATANIIAKTVYGIADDFLSTFLLAAKCPMLFAPAMNTAMLENEVTQENIKKLANRGHHMIYGGSGILACGDSGKGRMAEPADIFNAIISILTPKDMLGVNVLVSAGPTVESIDPVRFISNRSTGKMGYAIAKAAANRGANVTLVSGKVNIAPPAGVQTINIVSAHDMHKAVMDNLDTADIIIMAAAVADYTPETVSNIKIKKSGNMTIPLKRTVDIAAEIGKSKGNKILVGFAAETNDVKENALGKLERKNMDIIAANDVSRSDIGFGSDSNSVTMYFRDGTFIETGVESKNDVADKLLTEAIRLFKA